MTDKSGDDDKLVIFDGTSVTFQAVYDKTVTKVALGNLYIQRDIEAARVEHAKLVMLLESAEEHFKKAAQLTAPKRSSPPTAAAFLLAFIAPKNSAQALLGDLEEMFQTNADKFGEDRARRLYWFEVARSIGPLVWQWVKRMGFLTLLVDYVRSKLGF